MNWELTIDTIQSGKCILFLGPELFTTKSGKRLDELLLDYLKVAEDDQVRVYEDGLFFFQNPTHRTLIAYKIRKFFEAQNNADAQQLFDQIAQIPFHFIISITPDHLLERTFTNKEFKHKSAFYFKKDVNERDIPVPKPENPLIYNMLGSVEYPESLILNHNDLFDYLESVFEGNKLSNTLRDHILSGTQSILFLGVPFERWYMQLIMRMLDLHNNKNFLRFADSQNLSEKIKVFGEDEFYINFISNNIPEFIDEIYQRCQTKGLLRTTEKVKTSIVENLINQFKGGKLEELFEPFEEWLERLGKRGEHLLVDLDKLMSRYRRHERKKNQGVVNYENASVTDEQINSAMLTLLNQAKQLE